MLDRTEDLKLKLCFLDGRFAAIGQLTSKSDVYSFGVVLLELLTGRKPLDRSKPHQEQSLVVWVCVLLVSLYKQRAQQPSFLNFYYCKLTLFELPFAGSR